MNHMFPNLYSRPWKDRYMARTEDVELYSHYEKYSYDEDRKYCEYCDEELVYGDDGWEDCDCKDAQESKSPHPKISKMTLQSLLDLLPEGVKPSDVKMFIKFDSGDMGVYGHSVHFVYEKTFPDNLEQFEKDSKQYEENWQAYLVEKAKYDAWVNQQEIQRLEEKLATLKK